jgi:peptidoglycan hydrolase-like protein with peptidoglycan-binding domain
MNSFFTIVQQRLNDLDYGPLVLTGIEDEPTRVAVQMFQRAKSLVVDGIVGLQTLRALDVTFPTPTVLPWSASQPDADDVAQALVNAYKIVTDPADTPPTAAVLALLMAHTSFETRPSGQAMGWNLPNFNFAGIKASPWDPFVQSFETTEGQGPQATTLTLRFAAYQSLQDGAEAYIRTLKARSAWWNGLLSGTPDGLVRGLTTPPAYFTGDAGQYLAGLRGLVSQYVGTAARYAVG